MERELKRVDTIARVRRALHAKGWSMKKITRELHVSRNPVRKIRRSGETDFRYEREHQPLPKIADAVCADPDQRAAGIIRLCMLTGARCGEAQPVQP